MLQTSNGQDIRLSQKIISRLVHDMVSPIGAISNGIELLGLSAKTPSQELSLIDESCAVAASRLRVLRLAFGNHSTDSIFGQQAAQELRKDWETDNRTKLNWQMRQDISNVEAQLGVLAALCFRSAMPRGGVIHVENTNGQWTISCEGDGLQIDRALWHVISGVNDGHSIASAQIHFTALRLCLTEVDKNVDLDLYGATPILRF